MGWWDAGESTLSDLHVIIWKFIIIHFTAVDHAVDTDAQRFVESHVWKAAVWRQKSRLEAHAEKIRRRILWNEGPVAPKVLEAMAAEVTPLVESYTEDGEQVLSKHWRTLLRELDL